MSTQQQLAFRPMQSGQSEVSHVEVVTQQLSADADPHFTAGPPGAMWLEALVVRSYHYHNTREVAEISHNTSFHKLL